LVAAFGVLLGTAAHVPPSASLAAVVVIGCWLVVLAVRERRRGWGWEGKWRLDSHIDVRL
jgi:hypothetical protein